MRAMITNLQTLSPHDPLTRATEQILAGSQQDFPVVDDGQVVGILTRHDLLVGLTQHDHVGFFRLRWQKNQQ